MASKLLILSVVCSALSGAYAKSDGAPTDSCFDLAPQHGVDAQNTPAPYTISLSKKAIRSGDTVQITINGKSNGDTVKGFLIQARLGSTPVGQFEVSKTDKFMKAINCGSGKNNALTHVKHADNEDRKSFSATWRAPQGIKGQVTFYATLARNGGTFWVAEKSQPLNIH